MKNYSTSRNQESATRGQKPKYEQNVDKILALKYNVVDDKGLPKKGSVS